MLFTVHTISDKDIQQDWLVELLVIHSSQLSILCISSFAFKQISFTSLCSVFLFFVRFCRMGLEHTF